MRGKHLTPCDFIFWYPDGLETLKKEQDAFSLAAYLIIKNTETVYIILGE